MAMNATMLVVVVVVMFVVVALPHSVQAISVHRSGQHQASLKNVSCMLVFGDSSVDPGNNNHLLTKFKANFAPYGKNFLGGQCTGRFTDGRLPTDFTAESLGLEGSIPAFLDPKLKKGDLLKGVSFASAASGYDNFTATTMKVLPLAMQLEYFKHYKIHLKSFVGEKRSQEIVKNAVFILSMGTNDFMQNYFFNPTRPKQFSVDRYINYLTTCMAQDIKEMHRLGATRLVVVGLPPIGCMPLAKALKGTTECVEDFNKAAILLNSNIKNTLERLRISLGMKIGYKDIYVLFRRVMKHPTKYGLAVTTKGCCGSGMVEFGETCRGQSTCKDPSKYMFWDAVHPTEAMYKIVSDEVVRLIKNYILV